MASLEELLSQVENNPINRNPHVSAPERKGLWSKAEGIAAKVGKFVFDNRIAKRIISGPVGRAGLTALDTTMKVANTLDAAAVGAAGTIGSFSTLAANNVGLSAYNTVTGNKIPLMTTTQIANEATKIGDASIDVVKKVWSPGGRALMPHNTWNTIVRKSGYDGLAVSDRGVVPLIMDWGDPISNRVFGVAGKYAGKVARPVAKTIIGKPSNALYKIIAHKIVAAPNLAPMVEGAANYISKLENSRWSNISLRAETVAQNAKNYPRRLISRAETDTMYNQTKGMRRALFDFDTRTGKGIGKMLEEHATATPERKVVIENWLKSHDVVPPTGDLNEITSLRKSMEGIAKEDRLDVLQAAYLDSTGHLTEDVAKKLAGRVPGFTYTIDPRNDMLHFNYTGQNRAITDTLDNVRRIRAQQRDIGAPLLDMNPQVGNKILENVSGIGAMLGYISPDAQIPVKVRNQLQIFVNKWTTTDKLLESVPMPRVAIFNMKEIPNKYMGQITPTGLQVMSHEAKINIYDAYHEIAPMLDSLPDGIKENVLSFIATIPELMSTANTIKGLRGSLTPDLMKLLERNPEAALAELRKIEGVKSILDSNKVRSVNHLIMIDTELRNRGLNDAADYFTNAIHNDPLILGQKKVDTLADISFGQLQNHLEKAVTPTAARHITGQWRDTAIANIDNLAIDDISKQKLRRVYESMTDERLAKLKSQADVDRFLGVRDRKINNIIGKSGNPATHVVNPVAISFPSNDISPVVAKITADVTQGINKVDMLGQASIVKRVEDFVRSPYSLDSVVRQYYSLDASALKSGRFPGAGARGTSTRILDMAKQAAAESVRLHGYNPDVVPALSRMLGWQDDAYGRIMVNAGMMTAEDFARNKGTHLIKGYKFFTEKDAIVAYKTRLLELEKRAGNGDVAAGNEAKLLKEQWVDRELMRASYLRSIGQKPKPFALTVKAEDYGGFNISAFRRRQKLPVTLERVLQPFDNIADAWTLSQEIGTKNITMSNYYQTLKEMGVLVSEKSEAQHNYVRLEGGSWGPAKDWYAHPFLATRLQNQNLEGAVNSWTQLVGLSKKMMLADVMTTVRNVTSNMVAVHMGTGGASSFEITSSWGKSFLDHITNGEMSQRFAKIAPIGTGTGILDNNISTKTLQDLIGMGKAKHPLMATWDFINHVGNVFTTKQFALIEDVSKLTMFDILKKRNPMTTDLEHVLQVQKWMVDYHDVPAAVDFFRRKTGIAPFITYAYKMAGNVVKSTIENPEIATKMYGKVYRANQGNSIGGDFSTESAFLPKYSDYRLMLKLPSGVNGISGRDKRGESATMLDLSYFIPHSIFSPFFDTIPDLDEASGVAVARTLLGFSPLFSMASEVLQNKTFLGNPITYGGNKVDQGADYFKWGLMKMMPLFSRVARTLATKQHAEELGLGSGKSRTQQDWAVKFMGARHYNFQDQVLVEMKGIQSRLTKLRKMNIMQLDRIRKSEMVPGYNFPIKSFNNPAASIEQRTSPEAIIKRNDEQILKLMMLQQELDKKALKISHMIDMTDALGVDRAAAETYEQFIIERNEAGDRASNMTRLAEGIEAGDWTMNLAPSIKNAMAKILNSGGVAQVAPMPAPQQSVGTGMRGPISVNSEVKAKAGQSISRMSQPPLLPPPGRRAL